MLFVGPLIRWGCHRGSIWQTATFKASDLWCAQEIAALRWLSEERVNSKSVITSYSIHYTKLYDAKFGNFTKNSKHVETHYHFVNENYLNGLINIVKIDSEDNCADILTKALGRIKFEKFRDLLKIVK